MSAIYPFRFVDMVNVMDSLFGRALHKPPPPKKISRWQRSRASPPPARTPRSASARPVTARDAVTGAVLAMFEPAEAPRAWLQEPEEPGPLSTSAAMMAA